MDNILRRIRNLSRISVEELNAYKYRAERDWTCPRFAVPVLRLLKLCWKCFPNDPHGEPAWATRMPDALSLMHSVRSVSECPLRSDKKHLDERVESGEKPPHLYLYEMRSNPLVARDSQS